MKEELTLSPGSYFSHEYESFDSMLDSIHVWDQVCTYQMQHNAFHGKHHFLHLNNAILTYAQREGALLYDSIPPSECISIALVQEFIGESVFGLHKVSIGDILFFDSIQSYIMKTSMKFCIISIPKMHLRKLNLLQIFSQALNKKVQDTNSMLSDLMNNILENHQNKGKVKHTDAYYQESEDKIIQTLVSLLEKQEAQQPKLSRGEMITLEIRDSLYKHIDKKIDVKFLAEKYKISERTLQKSFKSLFGFSPTYFLRALKLNHVYKELRNASSRDTTVIRIASKWGFTHMGRFGMYYKELFDENPSVTLLQEHSQTRELEDFCATPTQEL